MLTPEQVQQARQAIGMQNPRANTFSDNSNNSVNTDYDSWLKDIEAPENNQNSAYEKPNTEIGILGNIGSDLLKRYQNIGQSWSDVGNRKISPTEAKFQAAGQVAGGINDILGNVAKPILNYAKEGLMSYVPPSIAQIFHPIVQQGLEALKSGEDSYNQWAKVNPRASKDVESAANILSLLPMFKGGEAASRGVSGLVDEASQAAKQSVKGLTENITGKVSNLVSKTQSPVEIAMPALNKAEKIAAVSQGRATEAGLFSPSKVIPSARDVARGNAISDIINPKEGLIPNVNKINEGISQEAQNVIDGLKKNDTIFNKNQLVSKLNKIEKDPFLVSDQKLNSVYDIAKNKFMEFVDQQPKKLSGLLEARKNFDQWIGQKIAKIWEDPTTKPLHQALRDMRTTANDFVIDKLPNNEAKKAFEDSLKKQNLMYESRDNMAEKAVKEEVGKNKIEQFTKSHPKTSKIIKQGALIGAGAIGAKELLR